ncbi:Uncharacterised protein [Candidatus Bilamarchaeum dharawalense]|uniref:Uncharacterized protein n=1 Tax=Candidatus Bilamarchaeum dharawalense TaxID=2885759 RepID=A0A5E4LSM6_9ARCH|nr:Uncharacterised protein [Candidatus Bilamarchaeum dharawalense]
MTRITRVEEKKNAAEHTRHPAIKFAAVAALFGATLVASPGQFINFGAPIPLAFTI